MKTVASFLTDKGNRKNEARDSKTLSQQSLLWSPYKHRKYEHTQEFDAYWGVSKISTYECIGQGGLEGGKGKKYQSSLQHGFNLYHLRRIHI